MADRGSASSPIPPSTAPGEPSALEKSLERIDAKPAGAIVAEAVRDAVDELAQSGLCFLYIWTTTRSDAAVPFREPDDRPSS